MSLVLIFWRSSLIISLRIDFVSLVGRDMWTPRDMFHLNMFQFKFYLLIFGAKAISAHLPAESPKSSIGSEASTILAA